MPGLLCAPVPDGVPAKDAAFTTVASIALHGLRLAEAGPGSKVVVIGLGLVGQLAARLAMAAGCDVIGIDPAAHARITAAGSGVEALDELGEATTEQVIAWSRGRGADAVLVCAASHSSAPVTRAPALCRDRAAIVIVGDVGLNLDRTPFYERELSLRFARSYGPGRYDPSYEAWGVDYPAGQVRWTEGRNFEAVLDLMAAGRLEGGRPGDPLLRDRRGNSGLRADREADRPVPGGRADVPAARRRRAGAAQAHPLVGRRGSRHPVLARPGLRRPIFAQPGPRHSILGQLSGAHDRHRSPGAPQAADQRALRGAADG